MAARAARWLAVGGAAYIGWRLVRRILEPSLTGRVALITGGSRGLGLVLARRLGASGCRIAICARDEAELDRARADLERRGVDVMALRCDVSDRRDVERMVDAVTERFERIDILVNNAGIIQVGPLELMTIEDLEQAMDVNFWGSVHTALAVLPAMRARGEGRICNITSIGGVVAIPHLLPYSCGKFAQLGFSEGLRAEVAKDGVSVTTIVPGLMRTGSPANALFKGDAPKEHAWFSLGDATPLTAMSAERAADRIARAIAAREPHVVLTWQAKVLRVAHDLAPGLTARALALVNRALPSARGQARGTVRGMEVASSVSPSFVTRLADRAARENNEYGGQHEPTREHAERAGLEPT